MNNIYNNHNNMYCKESNTSEFISNKKGINGYIKLHSKNKRNNSTHENMRRKSLNLNRRTSKNYNRNYTINNVEDYKSLSHEYIDEILRSGEYIQCPYSINNKYDKKKWQDAHCLRNRMKEYDLITRKKLYENNIINKKAKFDRERYIFLNKIPVFREAFPVAKDPSDKNKEAIIRTYLKTHAAYLLSEGKKNKKNFRKKKKFNNSLNNFEERKNPFNYTNYKSGYKKNNRKISENYIRGNIYCNLQKKENNEKIKNRSKTPFTNRNLKNCEIIINGVYNKENERNERNNFRRNSSRRLSNNYDVSSKILLNIKNFPKNIFNDNEKREESYEWGSNTTKMNINNCDNSRNTNFYDYSNECKSTKINDNSERNSHEEVNLQDKFSNHNNHTNENLTKLSNSSNNFYTKYDKNIFRKDRYSLLGKIKNNKDVKVKLVLNKV